MPRRDNGGAFYTIKEAAGLLQINVRTLQRYIRVPGMEAPPHKKMGSRLKPTVLFPKTAFNKWAGLA